MRLSTLLLLLLPFIANAQTPLPYTTGFDNAGQQAGWQQFRTGHLSNYSWGIITVGSPSPPKQLWHDYPVEGSAQDTVRDWYVSPSFDFSAGASLTLKVNVYSITGNAMPSDALKIMLLNGSNNPDAATATELFDLTPLVTSSSEFTDIEQVIIPPTSGTSYIAFYYQATQNWFTPGIDDVMIMGSSIGIEEQPTGPVEVLLRTGPGTAELEVLGKAANETLLLQLFNTQGALVMQRDLRQRTSLGAALPNGTYAYSLLDAQGSPLAQGRFSLLH